MMNQAEFQEYTLNLAKNYDLTLFDEEGEVGPYKEDQVAELQDYVFNVESSAIALHVDGKWVGQINLTIDYLEEKGTYAEIGNHTDNAIINKVVEDARKYYPERYQ